MKWPRGLITVICILNSLSKPCFSQLVYGDLTLSVGTNLNFFLEKKVGQWGSPGFSHSYKISDVRPHPAFSVQFTGDGNISEKSFLRIGGALTTHHTSVNQFMTGSSHGGYSYEIETYSKKFTLTYLQLLLGGGTYLGKQKIVHLAGGFRPGFLILNNSLWSYYSISSHAVNDTIFVTESDQTEIPDVQNFDISAEIVVGQALFHYINHSFGIEERVHFGLLNITELPTFRQLTIELAIVWSFSVNDSLQ